MNDVYTMEITFLTPVHIGTGEELNPFDFVIKDKTLYLIDLERWLSDNSDNTDISNAFSNKNFADLRKFVADNIPLEKYARAKIPIESNKLIEDYKAVLRGLRIENQVLVMPLPRGMKYGKPYIPGSSIKGAIRTAVGSAFVKDAGVTPSDKKDEKIFGNIKEDRFKNIKISDAPVSESYIVFGKEVSINPEKVSPPKGHFEVTDSVALGNDNAMARAKFLWVRDFELPAQGKRTKVDLNKLINMINNFYIPKYKEEMRKFYEKPHLSHVEKGLSKITQRIDNLKSNEALIRVGHFSHIECVTFDEVRKPKTREQKGKPLPWGTTRTLANGKIPFGWAILRFLEGYETKKIDTENIEIKEERKEKDEASILEERLQSLRREIYALRDDKMAGTLPNIAIKVINDKDALYSRRGAKLILEMIEERKKTKKFKQKEWFNKLRKHALTS